MTEVLTILKPVDDKDPEFIEKLKFASLFHDGMVELREFLSFSINFYSTIEFRLIDQILQAKNI